MRFGKIYALGEIEDWPRFTEEIISTIRYSSQNNNQWTWTYNKQKQGGQEMFLRSIQTYQLMIYDTQNDSLLEYMKIIAQEVLKFYPEHLESLSNLSIVCLINHDYDKALEYLLRAHKIDSKDTVVLNNIAHTYKLKGNKKMAINYYKKVVKLGDAQEAAFAKQQITTLSR